MSGDIEKGNPSEGKEYWPDKIEDDLRVKAVIRAFDGRAWELFVEDGVNKPEDHPGLGAWDVFVPRAEWAQWRVLLAKEGVDPHAFRASEISDEEARTRWLKIHDELPSVISLDEFMKGGYRLK